MRQRWWWAFGAAFAASVVAATSGVDLASAQTDPPPIAAPAEQTPTKPPPDFNGDGHADFVTGMPLVPVGGPLEGSGIAFVSFGAATGPFQRRSDPLRQGS